MNIKELTIAIENLTGEVVTQSKLAEINCVTAATMCKRFSNNSDVTVSELIRVAKHYGLNPCELLAKGKVRDSVEIKYYENPKVRDIITHSKVNNIWKDREVVQDVWGKSEKNLRVIKMFGDCMRGFISPGDILIIDTSLTNPLASGMYAFTSGNNDAIFIAILKQNPDNSITFSYINDNYESRTRTFEELNEINFEIIGKVIHNESKLI
jgi:hypothetical protein